MQYCPMLTWLMKRLVFQHCFNVLASVFDFLGEHQWIVDAIESHCLERLHHRRYHRLLGIRGTIIKLIEAFTGAGDLSGAISVIVTAFGKFAMASYLPIAIAFSC